MSEDQLAVLPATDEQFAANGPGDLDVVRIYNAELDAYGQSPRAGVPYLRGWEVVEPTAEQARVTAPFDPGTMTVAEVLARFDGSDGAAPLTAGEREAVVALEGAPDGKHRKTVLEWQPPDGD